MVPTTHTCQHSVPAVASEQSLRTAQCIVHCSNLIWTLPAYAPQWQDLFSPRSAAASEQHPRPLLPSVHPTGGLGLAVPLSHEVLFWGNAASSRTGDIPIPGQTFPPPVAPPFCQDFHLVFCTNPKTFSRHLFMVSTASLRSPGRVR